MPNRPSASSTRTEARRRARLAAQGRLDEQETQEATEEAETQRRPSFLERVIPPAPPLRGKTDPLATFSYDGPMRRVVTALYLLTRNPLAWLVPALVWLLTSLLPQTDQTIALISSIAAYVALIAAGWVGWQRPWLFGLTAALVGWLPIVAYLLFTYQQHPELLSTSGGAIPSLDQVLTVLLFRTVLQSLLGVVAGWYGGYLRRRLADQRPPEQRSRGRR